MANSREKAAFQFFNIVPCSPGNEEQAAADAVELFEKTGINTPLYCLTLHPEGKPAEEKAEYLVESYRKFRKNLEGTNLRPGILIQSILGHWPRIDKDEEAWTRTVDSKGNTPRFCPLDPDYRKYIFNTVVLLAKEHPAFLMGDDDIRAFSPNVECFCPLHTAEFNRRTGNSFTPEQYRAAVNECRIGDKIYTAFEQLRRDTTDGVAKLIREAIDSVDPSIPAGTCMPGWELRFNGTTSKAIAGKNQEPVMRVANAMYLEGSPKFFPANILHTQALRLFHSDIPCVLDEADTFPHNLYSRSARSMHAKLSSSIFCGLNGAKLWCVNCHKNGIPVNSKYTEILAENKAFYQTLAREVKGTELSGVRIPCFTRFLKWHPAHETGETFCSAGNWGESVFGVFGIPFRAEFDFSGDGIYSLAGKECIDRLSDEDLNRLFRRKLLIDGPAAAELTARGFSKYMGVEAEQKDFRFNREFRAGTREALPVTKTEGTPFLRVANSKAEILTELFYSPFSTSPELEKAAPGTVIFDNELGGRVCVTSFHPGMIYSLQNEARKIWVQELLDRLNGTGCEYVSADFAPVTMLFRKGHDKDFLELFNLGFDPMEEVSIRCAKIPARAERLLPSGEWEEVSFRTEGKTGTIVLPVRLECYEALVLRLK